MTENMYLNDFGIPNSPIEKKVLAYIEKERYFINFFEKKGMIEELESRVNIAAPQLENLKHEVLLHIDEGLSLLMRNVYKKLYKECIKFSDEINNIAHNNGIELNEGLNGEIAIFYSGIDESLGIDRPYKKKLSKEALKFKSDIENDKSTIIQKTLRDILKDPVDDYDYLLNLLKKNNFIEYTDNKICWAPKAANGNDTPTKYIVVLLEVLQHRHYLKSPRPTQKEKAEILSKTFNVKVSPKNYSDHKELKQSQQVVSDYNFIPKKD
ncbi:hypothetical protein N9Y48_00195 [Zobellia sp.]|nr:hypothetical protein [Zobellia sp.]